MIRYVTCMILYVIDGMVVCDGMLVGLCYAWYSGLIGSGDAMLCWLVRSLRSMDKYVIVLYVIVCYCMIVYVYMFLHLYMCLFLFFLFFLSFVLLFVCRRQTQSVPHSH
jgi:hypothetical protein